MLQQQLERCADFLSACPRPRKVEFRSQAKARKRARQLHMDFYKCVCGSWHLSSKVPHPEVEVWPAGSDNYGSLT